MLRCIDEGCGYSRDRRRRSATVTTRWDGCYSATVVQCQAALFAPWWLMGTIAPMLHRANVIQTNQSTTTRCAAARPCESNIIQSTAEGETVRTKEGEAGGCPIETTEDTGATQNRGETQDGIVLGKELRDDVCTLPPASHDADDDSAGRQGEKTGRRAETPRAGRCTDCKPACSITCTDPT